jgi:FKBP-type peptidyl-prolyl cis-trans isomerase
MKNFPECFARVLFALFLCGILLGACKKDNTTDEVLDADTSYAFGMILASQVGLNDLSFDYEAFKKGFMDSNEAKETRLTQEQAMEKINAVFFKQQSEMEEKMRLEGDKYLEENAARPGVTTTASGLQYEVLTQGSGKKPAATDVVRVNYEGTLLDGTVFDSSYARGEPVEFPLDRVIRGWTEGVQLMNEGSTFRFVIPSDLAYGPGGGGPIPPNATLIFKVELISILDR